jgi:hypothetical protein
MADSAPGIEFTTILYGIAASNALFRISYEVGLRTLMLLFAFILLATDWLEYRLSVDAVPDTVDARLRQFGLDMLILVVWTLLTVIPATAVPAYVAVVAAVVGLQGLWDVLLLESPSPGVFVRAEWVFPVACGALLVGDALVRVRHSLLFVAVAVLFVGLKTLTWRTLYRRAKREGVALRI